MPTSRRRHPLSLWAALCLFGAVPTALSGCSPVSVAVGIGATAALVIAEEHVRRGGMGLDLVGYLVESGVPISGLHHRVAGPHVNDGYGTQKWLRERAGLDPASVVRLTLDCADGG